MISEKRIRAAWILAALLSLACAADSVWLYIIQENMAEFASSCRIGEGFDCSPALRSQYGRIFGISLSSYGVATYVFFAMVSIQSLIMPRWRDRNSMVLLGASVGATLFCAWLVYVSLYRLRAYCTYCLVLHILTPLLLLVALYIFLRCRRTSLFVLIGYEWRSIVGDWRIVLGLAFTGIFVAVMLPWTQFRVRERELDAHPSYRQIYEGTYPRITEFDTFLAGRPFKGDTDAAVTIIEFGDYTCPVCRESQFLMEQMVDVYGAKMYFIDYPRDQACNPYVDHSYPGACVGAAAAKYAELHGDYWRVHDAIFDDPEILKKKNEAQLAAILGIPDMGTVLADPSIPKLIAYDIAVAHRVGLKSTPVIFINGMGMEGMPPDWFISGVVEREMREARNRSSSIGNR